ncbi:hypothetical protein AADZ90_012610 [Aestuariibius sp. 2305UL40-4]|uniref:hypothetical protein n=1 Tax=Aestuariibius violaceus TaxID=3234132 RepID=UPI00345EA305
MAFPEPTYVKDIHDWLEKNVLSAMSLQDFMLVILIRHNVDSAEVLSDLNIQLILSEWRQKKLFGDVPKPTLLKPEPLGCKAEVSVKDSTVTRKFKCDKITLGSKATLLADQYLWMMMSPEEIAASVPQKLDEMSGDLKLNGMSSVTLKLKPAGSDAFFGDDTKVTLTGKMKTAKWGSYSLSGTQNFGGDKQGLMLTIGDLKVFKGGSLGFTGSTDFKKYKLDAWQVGASLKIRF